MAASSATLPRRRFHRIAGASRTHKRISVELPIEVFDDIRAEVGRGNVSDYLVETVEAARRHRALGEWLDLMDATHGPVSPENEEKARRIWEGEAG
jgi:hypothetical protein